MTVLWERKTVDRCIFAFDHRVPCPKGGIRGRLSLDSHRCKVADAYPHFAFDQMGAMSLRIESNHVTFFAL